MIISFTTVAPEAHLYIHPLVVFIQITDHKAVTTVQKNKIVHRVKTTFQILKAFLRGFDLCDLPIYTHMCKTQCIS